MKSLLVSLLTIVPAVFVVAGEPPRAPVVRDAKLALVGEPEANNEESSASKIAGADLKDITVTIKTARGDIDCTVFASKTPLTAANFLNLAKRGFYDGLKFHRVIPDFMIQGGDPQGNGSGGPGYSFEDETRKDLLHDKPGVLSMANSDRGKKAYSNVGKTNGSQFFITHKDTAWLDGMHTVFGQVTKGQEVVDAIRQNDRIEAVVIHDDLEPLFAAAKVQLDEWNKILDKTQKKK